MFKSFQEDKLGCLIAGAKAYVQDPLFRHLQAAQGLHYHLHSPPAWICHLQDQSRVAALWA